MRLFDQVPGDYAAESEQDETILSTRSVRRRARSRPSVTEGALTDSSRNNEKAETSEHEWKEARLPQVDEPRIGKLFSRIKELNESAVA